MKNPFLDSRNQFPAFQNTHDGKPLVYLDGPAGTQVPTRVIDAISNYYRTMNANHGGCFPTSRASDAMFSAAQQAAADLFGTNDPEEVYFGANMTTLTFALSRALSQEWKPGDRILVSHLDHDANYSTWVRAAQDRGVIVDEIEINTTDCTLDLEDFDRKLTSETKLVAFCGASNAVGTRTPITSLTRLAQSRGAMVFIDAVHLAPHALMDVQQWGADFVACSAYKFFGPHIGIVWGKKSHLQRLRPYKVRPCAETLPDRWMTGTQNFACIAGVMAAIDYLADLSIGSTRREKLQHTFERIEAYERILSAYLIKSLQTVPDIRIYGITDLDRMADRVPTLSFTHPKFSPIQIAEYLGSQGICVWHGNYYALPLTERLHVEPAGMVRVGLLHYNLVEEVDQLVDVLKRLTQNR
jgi:cysteine desulfurase family protein (TIGR01976 family)